MCRLVIINVLWVLILGYLIDDIGGADTAPLTLTWTDKLRRDLLKNYDKFARPTQHFNVTNVRIGLEVYHVNIDEVKSSVNIKAYVTMVWVDEKLKWNESNYGNLKYLQVGNHEVWQPDITVINSVGSSSIENYGDTPFVVYPNGKVRCSARTQFQVICDLDLRLWPFDTQVCDLEIGSWTYSGEQINLRFLEHRATDIKELKNAAWKFSSVGHLVHVSAQGCCSEDPHDTIVYTFTIKRNSTLFASVFVTPTIFIVILNLVIFWLPPQSKEKLTLCSVMAAVVCLFLVYFTHKIPSSAKTPLIVSFYSACLYQLTMAIVISAVVINLMQRSHCQPLPRLLKTMLMGRVGKYLGLCDIINLINSQRSCDARVHVDQQFSDVALRVSNGSSNGIATDKPEPPSHLSTTSQLEWQLFATAIDRVSFLFFTIVFALMGIVCMA